MGRRQLYKRYSAEFKRAEASSAKDTAKGQRLQGTQYVSYISAGPRPARNSVNCVMRGSDLVA
jgi:hypothetical protein